MEAIELPSDNTRRNTRGLSIRFVPYGDRGIRMNIQAPFKRLAPGDFVGQRAMLLLVRDGQPHRLLPCTICPPEGDVKSGIEYRFIIQLDEPHRFDELECSGMWSRIREISFRSGPYRDQRIDNLTFIGSRES